MIRIESLDYAAGAFALRDVSLEVAEGEYFVLLGPSGSGKTLLLECLCGLNRTDSGRILLDGVDVTRREPRHRHIGYLPQDYALFPHLTVADNMAYGLGGRKRFLRQTDRHDQPTSSRQWIHWLTEMLAIGPLMDRRPGNLSGGEKQRVALARALAIRPKVLLLDEPVSALDEQTRDTLCRALRRVQRETATTTIHVCHNFAEMLAVADSVAIIHQGTIVQQGDPRQVLRGPRNQLVARFVQAGNILAASERGWIRSTKSDSSARHCVIRPEDIELLSSPPPDDSDWACTVLKGKVIEQHDAGPVTHLQVRCAGELELSVYVSRREQRRIGSVVGGEVWLRIDEADVHELED